MALDFLIDIQDISRIIFTLKRSLFGCNCNDICTFSQEWNECSEGIGRIYNKLVENNNPVAGDIKQIVGRVRSNTNNLAMCAEVIENQFIPLLYSVVSGMGKIDIEEGGYRFVSSKSGLINIQILSTGNYMYNIVDPLLGAWDNATYIYAPNANNIVLMGCGLGYLAYLLWKKSFESAHIYIYEQDPKMIEYARDFGALEWISPENLTIIVEEDSVELFDKFVTCNIDYDRSLFHISDWVVDSVDERILKKIHDFIENQKGANRFKERFDVNYYKNIDVFKGTIVDLKAAQVIKNASCDNEFVVVAAGPSLNKKMDYLREIQDKKTIVAVDAVLKKLLANGIKPDYVTALDPNKSLMHYLDGIEEQTVGIPLIADSVVYWKYVNNYQGPVYRICSSDSKLNTADKEKYNIPDLGAHGTVSGLAIAIAIYFDASTIELVGLDLSFPGGKHHADGLGINVSDKAKGEISVVSVNGDMVETNQTFETFLRGIEGQIDYYKDVVFKNLSDGGAYIRGALCGRWYEKSPEVDEAKAYFDRLADETIISWSEKYYIARQYYNKLLRDGWGSNKEIVESGIFDALYKKIKQEFSVLVRIEKGNGQEPDNKQEIGNKFIILLSSNYNIGEETSRRMMEDAYQFRHNHGYNVLIINSNEYLGGTRVALEEDVCNPCRDTVLNDTVVYMGERYPYIQCNADMPDAEYTEKVCNTLKSYNIAGIIAYDSMSLLAEACKNIGFVEYRYGVLKDAEQ